MTRRRPDLIVPVRDRRQHRRIVTVRNVRNAIVVLVLAFAIASIVSERRGRNTDSYGRLYSRSLPPAPVVAAQTPPPVVEAQPIADQTGADPMLIVPAARGQWLLEDEQPQPVAPTHAEVTRRIEHGEDVAIVGGREGISVVTTDERPKPVLRGGIFRGE